MLYASAEESTSQVRARADRLGAIHDDLWLTTEAEVPRLIAQIIELAPALVVVDSIQTVRDPDLTSAAGSVGQVRECAAALVRTAKDHDVAVMLVGHVTKDGSLAGPRVLEHLVDTVLTFEGDRHHSLRLLRASKHRFGSTEELGVFEMTSNGLEPVVDPSKLFLDDRRADVPGSVVVPVLDGYRPLLVEVQALTTDGAVGNPRRLAHGVEAGRLAMVLAVLAERVRFDVGRRDVHALAVGGVRVVEPAADLALALAIASSLCDIALPHDLVAAGEIGLGGELRQAHQTPRRLAEAARLGFVQAIVPRSAPEPPPGIRGAARVDRWRSACVGITAPALTPTTIRRRASPGQPGQHRSPHRPARSPTRIRPWLDDEVKRCSMRWLPLRLARGFAKVSIGSCRPAWVP